MLVMARSKATRQSPEYRRNGANLHRVIASTLRCVAIFLSENDHNDASLIKRSPRSPTLPRDDAEWAWDGVHITGDCHVASLLAMTAKRKKIEFEFKLLLLAHRFAAVTKSSSICQIRVTDKAYFCAENRRKQSREVVDLISQMASKRVAIG